MIVTGVSGIKQAQPLQCPGRPPATAREPPGPCQQHQGETLLNLNCQKHNGTYAALRTEPSCGPYFLHTGLVMIFPQERVCEEALQGLHPTGTENGPRRAVAPPGMHPSLWEYHWGCTWSAVGKTPSLKFAMLYPDTTWSPIFLVPPMSHRRPFTEC